MDVGVQNLAHMIWFGLTTFNNNLKRGDDTKSLPCRSL